MRDPGPSVSCAAERRTATFPLTCSTCLSGSAGARLKPPEQGERRREGAAANSVAHGGRPFLLLSRREVLRPGFTPPFLTKNNRCKNTPFLWNSVGRVQSRRCDKQPRPLFTFLIRGKRGPAELQGGEQCLCPSSSSSLLQDMTGMRESSERADRRTDRTQPLHPHLQLCGSQTDSRDTPDCSWLHF